MGEIAGGISGGSTGGTSSRQHAKKLAKVSKNRPQTLQNRGPGPPKSSPEPSKTQFSQQVPPPLNDLKLNVLKNDVLKGSGLDFGGPGPRFWRLGASNWKPPGLDFGDFVAFKNVCLKCMAVPQHSCPKFNPAPANLKCMPVLHPSCPKLGRRRRWYPQRNVFNYTKADRQNNNI